MSSFQLVGIDAEQFASLFDLSDEQLRQRGIVRLAADKTPGFPCRVSLEDAKFGEEVLLLPYVHQPASSPYRASGPIFVSRSSKRAKLAVGDVPLYVTRRVISVRAYDTRDMMVSAAVCDGTAVAAQIDEFFRNSDIRYIHLHNAKQGCFSCQVNRV